MPTNKTYKIESLNQIANIATKENVNELCHAFRLSLISYVVFVESIKKENNLEQTINSDISEFAFEWTDDGDNESQSIKIIDKDSGEVTEKII